MPCTAGGRPVMIERLLGLVKLGITHSAMRFAPSLHDAREIRRDARFDRLLDVAGLRAVDADDDRGIFGAVIAAVDRKLRWTSSPHFTGTDTPISVSTSRTAETAPSISFS
jgi:hypothetical protein